MRLVRCTGEEVCYKAAIEIKVGFKTSSVKSFLFIRITCGGLLEGSDQNSTQSTWVELVRMVCNRANMI